MIPILIGAAALFGLGAHAVACADNEEAHSNNNMANEIIEQSNRNVTEASDSCHYSINRLAMTKSVVLKGNMKRFVYYFSKIRPVNFKNTGDFLNLLILVKIKLWKFVRHVIQYRKFLQIKLPVECQELY